MSDLVKLYQNELKLLKESAKTFSEDNPALTESLTRDSVDPDVEMILQGVSYLTAQFKKEMDSQFPVALQAMSQVLTPSLMQPIPSVSVLSLSPKSNLMKPLHLSKGRYFDSVPIMDDKIGSTRQCRFTNTRSIDVLPIQISSVSTQMVEKKEKNTFNRVIELNIEFDASRNDIANYQFDTLQFYLNMPITEATLWLLMFSHKLIKAEIKDDNGVCLLGESAVRLSGFEHDAGVFEHDSGSCLHRMLQDYYVVPETFLFIDVGLNEWRQREGERFTCTLQFNQPNWSVPPMGKEQLLMYCVPIINQFDQYAEPVSLDDASYEYPISAQQQAPGAVSAVELPIIDVIQVESVKRNRQRNRKYQNLLTPDSLKNRADGFHYYRKHGSSDTQIASWLSLQFGTNRADSDEVLRAKVTCCHGELASKVNPGDITVSTSSSPELVEFTNVTSTTEFLQGTIASHTAWQVVSDQALSLQSIKTAEQLKNVLLHHIPAQLDGSAKQKTNIHRINGIETLEVSPRDDFKNGVLKRGVAYHVSLNGEHFVNAGEQFFFAAILDQLFALQAPINSFSQLTILDLRTGEESVWPLRMGTATE